MGGRSEGGNSGSNKREKTYDQFDGRTAREESAKREADESRLERDKADKIRSRSKETFSEKLSRQSGEKKRNDLRNSIRAKEIEISKNTDLKWNEPKASKKSGIIGGTLGAIAGTVLVGPGSAYAGYKAGKTIAGKIMKKDPGYYTRTPKVDKTKVENEVEKTEKTTETRGRTHESGNDNRDNENIKTTTEEEPFTGKVIIDEPDINYSSKTNAEYTNRKKTINNYSSKSESKGVIK